MYQSWERREMHPKLYLEIQNGGQLEDIDVDGRIMLKLTSKKWGVKELTEGRLFEHGNELSGFIRGDDFLG
jgi:hypothetical protein